jgi:hypothetical protein
MSTITQLAKSPASSRAHRWIVRASLKVLLSSSSLVTAITRSIRRVMARTAASAVLPLSRSRGVAPLAAAAGSDPATGFAGAAVTTSSRAPSCNVTASTVRDASAGPSGPSSLHSTCRAVPVRATAASWLCTAARDGRSTNAVSGLPVAYPGGAPIRSPALPLARRTVPSGSSTNKGAGAPWKTPRSKARSALSESC